MSTSKVEAGAEPVVPVVPLNTHIDLGNLTFEDS
jgi:hypothetical protein